MTDAVLDRLRTYIYLRDVHPMEWFEDFDKLNCGKITVEQFHRVFRTIRFELTDDEFKAIADQYITDKGLVDYRAFIDTIQNVFSNKDLEKTPNGTLYDSKALVTRQLGYSTSNNGEDNRYKALYAKMYHQILHRGVHIREAYQDFDRHNNGTVTQSQFFRAMPFTDLSAVEMQMLVKKYADPILRDINYRRLINDVNTWAQQNTKPQETFHMTPFLPHQLNSIKMQSFDRDTDELMMSFAAHVREKRIRIIEFFKQHDPLNKGYILREKFEGVMTLFGYTFTDSNLLKIVEKYLVNYDSTEYVNYAEFCHDITNLGGTVENTLKTRNLPQKNVINHRLDAILSRVKDTIVKFRINVLPTIQDFDRLGRGYITRFQFHRALATLRIHITDEELGIICEVYEDENGVDFYKFVEDVDPTHTQSRRSFQPIGEDKASIIRVFGHTPTGDEFVTPDKADEMIYNSKRGLVKKVGESHDIDALLFEMKRWSYVNSVDFHDFLSDFDRNKINEITYGNFRTGIGLATYKLTDSEFELIKDNYTSPTRPGFIQWRRFADDIIQAIAPLNLEKDPVTTPQSPKDTFNPRYLSAAITRGVSNESEPAQPQTPPDNVKRLLEIVARLVKARRISLIEQFKDKDRFNHKRVTATGFAQIIQLIGAHLSKNEIDVLCGFYNDSANNFVDYTKFVDDIDQLVGLLFGDRAATSIVAQPIPPYNNDDSPYLISRKRTDLGNPQWEEIKTKLQTYIYKRRIRIEEFFLAFDNLRSGKVTDQKFRSVIGQTDLPLESDQIDFLINMFRVPDTNDMFDYRTFCHQLNKIFGKRELCKKPVDKGKPRTAALPDPSMTLQSLQIDDQQRLEQILKRMRYMVKTRRMNIREQFEDYDRMPHKNFITKQQFRQCIARLGLSTDPREFDVLCRKYKCTDLEDMNYHSFCDDVDVIDQSSIQFSS
ncbi:hypothetical protein TRFO_37751 [Tritrichomonas foetus]|uniref:EF hand family protein n=1 Tax=Tritrichomonas foetus TaxID=1144522 RepID=A0A1J4JF85_9EUKA|nr:hypothetical protein TRFO_37751 [Tritrichomonas foetus]|eukprot:OHS96109.1 hypothetical protein TRFO_37751 [Tritrichomonas foetus]